MLAEGHFAKQSPCSIIKLENLAHEHYQINHKVLIKVNYVTVIALFADVSAA